MKVKATVAVVTLACAGLVLLANAQSRQNETSDQRAVTTATQGADSPTMLQSSGTNTPPKTNAPSTNMPPAGTNHPPMKTNMLPSAANNPQPGSSPVVR